MDPYTWCNFCNSILSGFAVHGFYFYEKISGGAKTGWFLQLAHIFPFLDCNPWTFKLPICCKSNSHAPSALLFSLVSSGHNGNASEFKNLYIEIFYRVPYTTPFFSLAFQHLVCELPFSHVLHSCCHAIWGYFRLTWDWVLAAGCSGTLLYFLNGEMSL